MAVCTSHLQLLCYISSFTYKKVRFLTDYVPISLTNFRYCHVSSSRTISPKERSVHIHES